MGKNESRRGRGEGALFYREDRDRWMGRVVVDGKRHQISAKTKTEARRKLEELRRTASDGLPVTPGSLTMAELFEMWSAKALPNRRLSPSRLAAHRWAISILTEELGTVRLRNLTAERVEAAFARRAQGVPMAKKSGRGRTAGAPLTKNSLVKIRSTLNQALTWAQRRDLVARNIAPTVEIPSDAAPSRSGKTMTVDQAQRFLAAAAGTDLEAMWTVMIYLGVRPGEAAGIAWSDIDFDNGIVHIWRARKASDKGQAIVGETKNAGSVRSLDTPAAVLTALRTHRERQVVQIDLAGSEWANEDDLVFTSPTGRPTDPKAVRKEFARIIEASGVEGDWTPNLLRHTAASLMAHAGMPIEQVADQLGHTDLRMLQQHYRHRIKRSVDGASAVAGLLRSEQQ